MKLPKWYRKLLHPKTKPCPRCIDWKPGLITEQHGIIQCPTCKGKGVVNESGAVDV